MNNDFEEIKCAVCESRDNKTLFNGKNLNPSIYVAICKNCGLIYLNPRWKKEKYKHFYSNDYDNIHRDYLIKVDGKKSLQGRAVQISNRAGVDSNFKNYLDIGAGEGSVLEFFGNKNSNAVLSAIEPSEACHKILKDKNIKLLSNDVDSDWHLGNENKFDFIILRHTLEHLLDPLSVLKKIKYVLSDNGLIYISVPNMMMPRSDNLLKKSWFIVSHTYYFSKSALLSLISRSGLKPVKIIDVDCELWGVFKKGEFEFRNINNYWQQRLALFKHHFKFVIKYVLKVFRLRSVKN